MSGAYVSFTADSSRETLNGNPDFSNMVDFFEIICCGFLVLSGGKARSICALNVQMKILLAN